MLNLSQTSGNPPPPKRHRASELLALLLTVCATALMMLCPCDTVGFHDYKALSLLGGATLFGIAAAVVLYRRVGPDSQTSGFLRAVLALAIAGISVYVELIVAMEIVAFLAKAR